MFLFFGPFLTPFLATFLTFFWPFCYLCSWIHFWASYPICHWLLEVKMFLPLFFSLLHVYVLLFWHFLALQKLGTVFENELPIIQKLVRNHLLWYSKKNIIFRNRNSIFRIKIVSGILAINSSWFFTTELETPQPCPR